METERTLRTETEEAIRLLAVCRKPLDVIRTREFWRSLRGSVLIGLMLSAYICATKSYSYTVLVPLGYMMVSFAVTWLTVRYSFFGRALRGIRSSSDDIRLAGPLAESLQVAHLDLHQEVESKLIRILGQAREEDAGLLSPRQKESLHRALFGVNE